MGRAGIKDIARERQHLDRARQRARVARAKLEAAIVRAAAAGGKQRDLASAASVSQPYVSQLVAQHRGRFVPTSHLGYLLAGHRDGILRIARQHRLTNLRVFGSVARGDDCPTSDIDLMADLPQGMGLLGLSKASTEWSDLLGVQVDLIPARSLKANVRPHAMRDAVPL
jgi:predicted nucleotidyltransferase